MSIMREAFERWQPKIAEFDDVAVAYRPKKKVDIPIGYTICDYLPDDTTSKMKDLPYESYFHKTHKQIPVYKVNPQTGKREIVDYTEEVEISPVEAGASIDKDLKLGPVTYGDPQHVGIIRTEGDVGTYHVHHRSQSVKPSSVDIQTMMRFKDEIMCIGNYQEMIGTRIKCYTPHEPEFSDLKDSIDTWTDDWYDWNSRAIDFMNQRGQMIEFETAKGKKIKSWQTLNPLIAKVFTKSIQWQSVLRDYIQSLSLPLPPTETIEQLEMAVFDAEISTDNAVKSVHQTEDDLELAKLTLENLQKQFNDMILTGETGTGQSDQIIALHNAEAALRLANTDLNRAQTSYIKTKERYDEDIRIAQSARSPNQEAIDKLEKSKNKALSMVERGFDKAKANVRLAQEKYDATKTRYDNFINYIGLESYADLKMRLDEATDNVQNLSDKLYVNQKLASEASNKSAMALEKLTQALSPEHKVTEEHKTAERLIVELDTLELRRRELRAEMERQSRMLGYYPEQRQDQPVFDDCNLFGEHILSTEHQVMEPL